MHADIGTKWIDPSPEPRPEPRSGYVVFQTYFWITERHHPLKPVIDQAYGARVAVPNIYADIARDYMIANRSVWNTFHTLIQLPGAYIVKEEN